MSGLPMQWNTWGAAGSLWAVTFALKNDDGTAMSIAGKMFEFVIRPSVTDATTPPLVKVTPTSGSQGYITIDTVAATVLVVLTPAATTLLGKGARPHALWMDPGLSTAETLVEGVFNSQLVAAA
ncbi:hypothetical protein AB0H73_14755 [Streptomyces olivoreticuli]